MTIDTLLAAHTGGTKARLCLVELQSGEQGAFNPIYTKRYSIGDFQASSDQGFFLMLSRFMKDAEEAEPKLKELVLKKACLAVAGPIHDNTCRMTNLNLFVDGNRLAERLKSREKPRVQLINDFRAVAYGIQKLKANDLETLREGQRQKDGLIAVIGAATGLGKTFLLQDKAYATEGGHTDFTPRNDLEFDLLQYILENIRDENHQPLERVSVERVVSGRGIVAIYRFLRKKFKEENPLNLFEGKQYEGIEDSLEIERMIKTWQEEDDRSREIIDPAAAIAAGALFKRDRCCLKTMQIFLEAYGAEVGNFALQFLPYGGLYIGGGIAPQILPLIRESNFLNKFLDKGPMKGLLKKIPVYGIKNLNVGLMGAARYADEKM